MAQEIVKDYETVEKERTITVCDNCGRTDEESEIVIVAINPKQNIRKDRNLQLVDTFDDKLEADDFLRDHYQQQIPPIESNRYGVAWNHREHIMDMRASATADVCSHCLSKLFDINIDSEEIDDINIRDGEIKINITEEKVSIWPGIPEWGKTPHAAFQWGWKGRIISWPFTIVGILMDWGIVKSERKKGYLAGSVGAFLWFSLLFILIFILL